MKIARWLKWILALVPVGLLIAAAITLWVTYLAPFKPEAELASVMWKVELLQEAPQVPGVRSLVMVAQVHLVNHGAKSGRLDSLQILLERKADGKQWRFNPELFINYEEFLRSLSQARDPEARIRVIRDKVITGQFTPLHIDGRQPLTKAILFAPPNGLPVSLGELKQGDYLLRFSFVMGGRIKEVQIIPFRLTRDELEVLKEGRGQAIPIYK